MSDTPASRPLFDLGRLLATPGAMDTMARRGINAAELLGRHVTGDWGDLNDYDKRENQFSVSRELRILSAYGHQGDPDRLWVITEADRSVTTILRPDGFRALSSVTVYAVQSLCNSG